PVDMNQESIFFFSSRRRHTRSKRDWSSDVCSSDLKKTTKIVVEFKDIPMNLYYKHKEEKHPNLLVINISPDEGITLYLNAKKTGAGNQAEPINLSYNHDKSDGINTPEAYEKLIH